ncbi:MAG TPA: single-stranded DNA-binding protein [Actinomycetota bacterium]|nr:single-stranded DNA-binding protein [Actinomycetota bacterium]
MANDNQVTLIGNITDDPELRYTPSGTPVASFTVAINRRVRDQASGEWKDGDTSFFKCNVWRQQAENVAESLTKGTRVIVVGQLRTRSWETPEGQKRSVTEVEVDHTGPALQWATAQVSKTARNDRVPEFVGANGNGSSDNASDEEPPF